MPIVAGHAFVAPYDVNEIIVVARSALPLGRAVESNMIFSFMLDDRCRLMKNL